MSNYAEIHEALMNGSRMILPRVGGGVGGGVEGLVTHAYNLTVGAVDNPATSQTAAHPEARCMRGKPREIGGGSCQ